jgi:hypothetical protein
MDSQKVHAMTSSPVLTSFHAVFLTVLDWFSKYAHFIPPSHPYTTIAMTHAFFFEIARLHGIPCSIVSDRDPIFTSSFW